MTYYYVDNEERLTPLATFKIEKGQSQVVQVPVIGGTVFGRTRREPDTFLLEAASTLQQVGSFRVVTSQCTVYGCVGENISIENSKLVVAGVIHDRFEIEPQHKAQAVEQMRLASAAALKQESPKTEHSQGESN